jgi:hypothetical protein
VTIAQMPTAKMAMAVMTSIRLMPICRLTVSIPTLATIVALRLHVAVMPHSFKALQGML